MMENRDFWCPTQLLLGTGFRAPENRDTWRHNTIAKPQEMLNVVVPQTAVLLNRTAQRDHEHR